VILGGGLAGVGTAYALADAGWQSITVIERGSRLGGLAGSFEQDGKFYPLGYHHILHRDRTLLYFLDVIGALPAVRWRRIKMLFQADGALRDLSNPMDFLRFPLAPADKYRFARLMLHAFTKSDWSEWHDRSAAELVDHFAGRRVREAIFEPLTQLKFELSCSEVSGAWMGARLHFREGSAPLGYIPDRNWTTVLCDGLTELIRDQGVEILTDASVQRIEATGDRVSSVELADGRSVDGDIFVSSIPTEVYCNLLGDDETPGLSSIRYTALISIVCATKLTISPDFYWLNLTSLQQSSCAIFVLSSLNPTIGGPDETCLNFVTHLRSRCDPVFRLSDKELLRKCSDDMQSVLGCSLDPTWVNISRIPMYSPIFRKGYRNPDVGSATFRNMYFAGNYRTFPSIASTGTALRSGIETGREILTRHGRSSDLLERVSSYRLGSMPRP
jgi:protoporphyrinogen oxidase